LTTYTYLVLVPDSSRDHLQAASMAYRIAIGPHTGRKALTLYSVPPLITRIFAHVQRHEG
jgi:hypothetical protein